MPPRPARPPVGSDNIAEKNTGPGQADGRHILICTNMYAIVPETCHMCQVAQPRPFRSEPHAGGWAEWWSRPIWVENGGPEVAGGEIPDQPGDFWLGNGPRQETILVDRRRHYWA
jgi:hypothetical protein